MSTYIYGLRSETFDRLTAETNAIRLSKFDGLNFWCKGKPLTLSKLDCVICWGKHLPNIGNGKVLNGSSHFGDQLGVNLRANRMVLNVLTLVPIRSSAYDAAIASGDLYIPNYGLLAVRMFQNHGQHKQNYTHAYRIHVFNGNAILAGVELDGSSTRKCNVAYGNDGLHRSVPKEAIAAATTAIRMIGLTMAVVSVLKIERYYFVRKIVTAPKLTAEQATIYGKYINEWIEKGGKVVGEVVDAEDPVF